MSTHEAQKHNNAAINNENLFVSTTISNLLVSSLNTLLERIQLTAAQNNQSDKTAPSLSLTPTLVF